ncbi:unnamed protein product [Peronospora effusa]|nr:unnamed protein product [Peronospora effusa]
MRVIQAFQIVLVTMMLPLASSNGFATEIAASDSTRNLVSFEKDVTPNKLVKSREPIANTEERVAPITVIGFTPTHSQAKRDGKKRVVTKFQNKGVLQRLKHWFTFRRLRTVAL